MQKDILTLLTRLESINLPRDSYHHPLVHAALWTDLHKGYLAPIRDWFPTARYGLPTLSEEAVRSALRSFCLAGRKYASEHKLAFHDRLSAFQNLDLKTPAGNTVETFFGRIDPAWFDKKGQDLRGTPGHPPKPAIPDFDRATHEFNRPGSFEDLLSALNKLPKSWSWNRITQVGEEYLESSPQIGVIVLIRQGIECMQPDGSITPPDVAFASQVFATEHQLKNAAAEFLSILERVKATDVAELDEFDF